MNDIHLLTINSGKLKAVYFGDDAFYIAYVGYEKDQIDEAFQKFTMLFNINLGPNFVIRLPTEKERIMLDLEIITKKLEGLNTISINDTRIIFVTDKLISKRELLLTREGRSAYIRSDSVTKAIDRLHKNGLTHGSLNCSDCFSGGIMYKWLDDNNVSVVLTDWNDTLTFTSNDDYSQLTIDELRRYGLRDVMDLDLLLADIIDGN
jgi:hypothetical protein